MSSTTLSYDDYAIILVCALPPEMTAVQAMLEETHASLPQKPNDGNSYTLGRLSGHNVVIACLPSAVYGTTSAAIVLSQALLTFCSLKFGLMVGIGGGVPSKSTDIRLGDVVIGIPTAASGGVIQYDYGKALLDGRFQRTGSLNKAPQVLLSAVSQLRSESMMRGTAINAIISSALDKNQRIKKQFSRPDKDWLFNATYGHSNNSSDCSACDQSQLVEREPRTSHEPHIHYGLIASGNQVMKDAKTRDLIAQGLDILCFEMEAAGLMDQLPFLVIRGICDYCDSHKHKQWQGYAALAAAAYSRLLLTVVPSQKNDSLRHDANVRLNERLKARQMNVLKTLNVSPYRDQKDRNPVRIPGTCEWFITHTLFQDWQASRTSRMLWVSANPGCGKSVLAKYLADSVLTSDVSRTVGYFFFKDDFEDQKSIVNALSCILHQLFNQNRALLTETTIERFEMNERVTSSFSELWDILISVAKEPNVGEIICLLDALDECEQHGWSQFTEALRTLYKDETRHKFNLKFLITSRLYGRIRQGFQPLKIPGQPVIHLSGESDAEMEKISQEISLFIKARVETVGTQLQLTEDEQNLLLDKLTCVPNRTYLWAYLTLDLIESNVDIDKRMIVEATSNLPQTVDEAYERILSRSTDCQKARKLLHIIVGAARPLTLQEMNFALALRESHHSYSELDLGSEDRFRERIRGICGLFVTVIDSKIYLLHQTAREFLVQDIHEYASDGVQGYEWRHSLELQESHRILSGACIQHLLFADFQVTKPLPKDVRELTDRYIFLDYSAKYWTAHILGSGINIDALMQSLLMICDANEARCTTWFRVYWTSTAMDFPTGFTSLMIASYFGLTPVAKRLIKMGGLDLDTKDNVHGRSALSWAAGNGHRAVVKLLTKRPWHKLPRKRAQVDSADKHNQTPLSWAILNAHVGVVSLLLKAGAAVGIVDYIGGTPLDYAICSEDTRVVELMMKQGTHIRSKEDIKKELLLSAAKKGHMPVVKLLLKNDINIDLNERQNAQTPLSGAAENGHEAIVELLIEKGADVHMEDKFYGRTPLSWAARNGHESTVKLLIEKGANVHMKDDYGQTPLSWAARNGHHSTVKLLLEKGAHVDSKDKHYDWTPLSWAALHGHEAIVELLLEKGANVHMTDEHGRTPLSQAAENGHGATVKLLLEKGADINLRDKEYGQTPLSWAARNGHEVILNLLLEKGADVNLRDREYGRTPLSWAAKNGHDAILNLLLEKGADIDLKDRQYGRTLLSWAAEDNHEAVLDFLLKKIGLQSKILVQEFRDLVGVILLLAAPLSADALARFLGIPSRDLLVQFPVHWVHTAGDIRNTLGAIVHFLHVRFQGYYHLNTDTALHVGERELHKKIALQCLRVMCGSLKQNICGLPSYATKREDIDGQTITQCLPEDVQYSCSHWAYHLEQSKEPVSTVFGFLKKHLLHWLEAMSIMGMVSKTIRILDSLLALITQSDSKLPELLHEAREFVIRTNQIAADSAPLQLYALVTDESVIGSTFRNSHCGYCIANNRGIMDST